jgi:beta-xylosidase
VTVARSSSPTGPWESCPANPILTHRSLSHPIQNTGHADLVEATDGSWWMVLLGVRQRGQVPGFRALGRETFLVPMVWVDGWPVVGDLELEMPKSPPGEPSGHGPVPGRDDFDAPALGPEWISMRVPLGDAASLTERPGWLTLHGNGQDLDADTPVFAGRRQQHLWCRARTLVDPGDSTEAGLAIRMDEKSHHEVYVADGEIRVRARVGFLTNVIATAEAPEGEVILRLETHEDKWGPDIIQLGFETDGEFQVLAALDGKFLTTQAAGGFIGRVMGLFAVGGSAGFDWFDYEAIDN